MAFVPRTSVDIPSDMHTSEWYNSNENVYVAINLGLPNCPCYCYGRVAEIQGAWNTNLPNRTAKYWYQELVPIYGTIPSPVQGCLICYGPPEGSDAPGHVAVVEQVYANGSILISNSGYTRDPAEMERLYFWTAVVTPQEGYKESWMNTPDRQYSVQGFIYPYGETPPSTYQWHAKTGYGYETESAEAYDNCMLIWEILYSEGFTPAAAAGVCGNVSQESGYNPWIWEGTIELASTDTYLIENSYSNGYGLYGFTPPGKYLLNDDTRRYSTFAPHYSDIMGDPHDGDAQTRYMVAQEDPRIQWQLWRVIQQTGRSITFEQYKQMTDPEDAAYIYMVGLEGPDHAGANLAKRKRDALYWYNVFIGITPVPPPPQPPGPTPPTPSTDTKMPLWMYLRRRVY